MSAIKPNSLSKFAGMLSIAPVETPTNFSRLASVVGLAGNLEISDPVEIRAQDTGLVASFADLKAYATGKFLEVFDLELVKMLFGGTSFVVKIETLPDETGKSRVIILEKAKFDGFFADVSEAKELEGAEFTFNGEKNSNIIFYDEKL